MGEAHRRLRALRTKRLVARFAVAGCGLAAGAIAGWVLGFSATDTVAALCIGMPAIALTIHLAARAPGRRWTDDRERRFSILPRHEVGARPMRRRASCR
jgi:hypothetical protein